MSSREEGGEGASLQGEIACPDSPRMKIPAQRGFSEVMGLSTIFNGSTKLSTIPFSITLLFSGGLSQGMNGKKSFLSKTLVTNCSIYTFLTTGTVIS